MIHTLKSNELTVAVSSIGAELQSIFSNESRTEYLWQGDTAWWGSRAPVLFPLIGMSNRGKYVCGGKEYPAPRHGLVRSAYFHRVNESTGGIESAGGIPSGEANVDSLTLEYTDNPSTRLVFPFKFIFQVKFELNGATLNAAYRAVNLSGSVMPFCVGSHEAYNCADFTDCYLEFERAEEFESERLDTSTGLLTGGRYPVKTDGNILPLEYSLFDNDTLVFKNIASRKVALKSKNSPASVEVEYDAPNLAIWTKKGAPYICIEPWHGLPGNENDNLVLAERPGAVNLQPGCEFVFKHSIKVNRT